MAELAVARVNATKKVLKGHQSVYNDTEKPRESVKKTCQKDGRVYLCKSNFRLHV
jgi:hypothetical protein